MRTGALRSLTLRIHRASTNLGTVRGLGEPNRPSLPHQGEHLVVAVVPAGGKAVFRQLALDRQRALELLRHQLEGVSLQGVRRAMKTTCTGSVWPMRQERRDACRMV